jgi:hypothetical protein
LVLEYAAMTTDAPSRPSARALGLRRRLDNCLPAQRVPVGRDDAAAAVGMPTNPHRASEAEIEVSVPYGVALRTARRAA